MIRFWEAYLDSLTKDLCIVLDFAENGDLSMLIKQLKWKQKRL